MSVGWCRLRDTTSVFTALAALLKPGPHYGRSIADVTDLRSGTVTTILKRLQYHGWVKSTWETSDVNLGRPRRRYYQLTELSTERAREAAKR